MNKKELLNYLRQHAKSHGIRLNPEKEVVDRIINALLANEKKYGFRYCPCRVITGNHDEDRKNICPCFWHLDEIKKMGHCLCGLFVK